MQRLVLADHILQTVIDNLGSAPAKIALYKGKPPTKYTTTGEATGLGYTAGGQALELTTKGLSVLLPEEARWERCELCAASALIYDTRDGSCIAYVEFPTPRECDHVDLIITFNGAALLAFVI